MKQNKTNESGRSMVEMLGVLAVIGVLSVGGVTGYRYAMDYITVNKVQNFIQKFYVGMESGIADSESEMHVVCAGGNEGFNCKKQKLQQLCDTFLGSENCGNFQGNYWGGYELSGLGEIGQIVIDASPDGKYIFWTYMTRFDGNIYLQFTNFKPDMCQKIIGGLSFDKYPRLLKVAGYCNNGCGNDVVTNASDTKMIQTICSNGAKTFTLLFDGSGLDLVDATDED